MRLFFVTLTLYACRPVQVADKDSTDSSETSTEETEDNNGLTPLGDSASSNDTGKPDDEYDDTGKPEDESNYPDCGPNFDPNESCTGDWTTTICMHDSLIWWCENGAWMNEEEKPD